mgnify:CR=1 FL=1
MDADHLSARAAIRIHGTPDRVFSAFVEADAMSRFWFTRRDEGLRAGQTVTWFLGDGDDAMGFEIRVTEVERPDRIVIEWENGGELTTVTWSIVRIGEQEAILTIEETGFGGSQDAIIERVVDSTGGFNQVVLAAKAFVEHGIALDVVRDHA